MIDDYHPLRRAEREIYATYGDTVSVSQKNKTLNKFGKNDGIGTSWETLWNQGGNETYVTTNAITTISSSDAGDSGTVYIEGHTVSGTGADAQFTFVVQTATLNGQTEVTLTTPVARCSRVYNATATAWLGDIYVYEDDTVTAGVPQTATKIHAKVLAGENQTFKAATTFSNTDYFIMTQVGLAVNKKTSGVVDFQVERRLVGQLFRPILRRTLSATGQNSHTIDLAPYIIVPKNADIRISVIGSTTGIEANGSFSGYLASVLNT